MSFVNLWCGLRTRRAAVLGAVVLLAAQDSASRPVIVAASSPAASTDGTLDLSWTLPGRPRSGHPRAPILFQVEETGPGEASLLIEAGPHRALSLSGRDDGAYVYRVRALSDSGEPGPWSDPVTRHVAHHSLSLTFTLFSVGAVVFVATAGLVLFGGIASRRHSA